MEIVFADLSLPQSGTLVVGVLENGVMTPTAKKVDGATGGALARAVAAAGFRGKRGALIDLFAPAGLKLDRVTLLGLGKAEKADAAAFQTCGGSLYAHLAKAKGPVAVAVDPVKRGFGAPAAAAHLAYGANLRSYRFDKYRTKEKKEDKPTLARLAVLVHGAQTARRLYDSLGKIADAVFFARDLVSEPANVVHPESLARRAAELSSLGVKIEVLDERRMKHLGMGALLGVAQGSVRKPRVVVMRWQGNPRARDKRPLAFVGKGVTFDTGGISIKPANNMWDMKWDMAGSAVVIGLMRALALRKARVNAVGVVGLVENMPSGTAQRPGDIVKSLSGQTIEVLNTDAEGRLVLADALWYCQDRFKPRFMIDLATLTGAIVTALGHIHAGLFSNNDQLADRLVAAGKASGERVWRMPLDEAYDKIIDSDAADVKNIGDGTAGSITGAQFIQRFVNDVPWAHLDIAGMAWSKKDQPTVPRGATAFGLRLLNQFVDDYYEGK
ncbi:MAG: leucyl aminopeptidase [Alphaproteobacteria bacterium]